MAHVSHRLSNSFEGALAGGGDLATSPLYVFGPFLKLIVVAGVARVTFGVSIWLVVFTVVMVSVMYRSVMRWVTDGSGGSGLNEEEFGSWAVKVNAGITFVEYTLTRKVSVAALVTFLADRFPALNQSFLGFGYRGVVAICLSVLIGWVVNRGPKVAARAFGPATLAVLALLWVMMIATVWKLGFRLPNFDLRAFSPDYLHFTFGGYVRILALMTGIEIFANLVAAFDGTSQQKSRRAFGSLLIIMGTTSITMLVVGPAFLDLSDPTRSDVSVFTQTMDILLPAPLAYAGTLVGVVVLASAAAASAQGLQNLGLGLRYRHYVPASVGQRNRFDVADKPVWIEVAVVCVCFLAFGTSEETYLAIYAAGVFILLSMTGWAAVKRLVRQLRASASASGAATLIGAVAASLLTSAATLIIFAERFTEGAWTYLLFIPLLYAAFTYFRSLLGEPLALEDHLGRILAGQYLLPYQRNERPEHETNFDTIVVPVDGSVYAELALAPAEVFCHAFGSHMKIIAVEQTQKAKLRMWPARQSAAQSDSGIRDYLKQLTSQMKKAGIETDTAMGTGSVAEEIDHLASDLDADLIVMSAYGVSGVERWFTDDLASSLVRRTHLPVLLIRPTEEWKSRRSQFKRLLVTLDGSEGAEQVLRYTRAIAAKFESEIILLAVPEADSEQENLQHYIGKVAKALSARGLNVRSVVTGSGAARTILEVSESESPDLIMMATRGRGGLNRNTLIGSVADKVAQTAICPVFLVPASGRRPRLTRRIDLATTQ